MLKEEKTVAQLASEYGVHATQLHLWKAQALAGLPAMFEDGRKGETAPRAAHERVRVLLGLIQHNQPGRLPRCLPLELNAGHLERVRPRA